MLASPYSCPWVSWVVASGCVPVVGAVDDPGGCRGLSRDVSMCWGPCGTVAVSGVVSFLLGLGWLWPMPIVVAGEIFVCSKVPRVVEE